MGTWGTAFYSDDLTCDVRDTYRHLLRLKHPPESAVQELVKDFCPEDSGDEAYLFWLALADTQWRLGHLTQELRERALSILDSDADDSRWSGASVKEQKKRRAVMQQVKSRLSSPQPPPKKVAPYRGEKCPWKVGDFVSIRFTIVKNCVERSPAYYGKEWLPFQGSYGVFQVVGISYKELPTEQVTNEHPVVAVLDWLGTKPITPEQLEEKLDVLPWNLSGTDYYFLVLHNPLAWERKDYELELIGHSESLPEIWGSEQYLIHNGASPCGVVMDPIISHRIHSGQKSPDQDYRGHKGTVL